MNGIQVAHAVKPNFGIMTEQSPDPTYPDGYVTVAIVEVPDGVNPENFLGEAFRLTNHINSPWWDNPGVTLVGQPQHRSTSVGDIMVLPNERKFRCEMAGWKEIL